MNWRSTKRHFTTLRGTSDTFPTCRSVTFTWLVAEKNKLMGSEPASYLQDLLAATIFQEVATLGLVTFESLRYGILLAPVRAFGTEIKITNYKPQWERIYHTYWQQLGRRYSQGLCNVHKPKNKKSIDSLRAIYWQHRTFSTYRYITCARCYNHNTTPHSPSQQNASQCKAIKLYPTK